MRILVTGATGVVGQRAVPLMVSAGHQVTAVGRTPEKRARLERMGASAIPLDLFDAGAVRQAVVGHDVVLNLATHIPPTSRMLLPGAWRANDRIRRTASANLVDAAITTGVGRFIQESFAPIYVDQGDRWIDEQFPIRPVRYNRSVLDAEAAAERFTRSGRTGVTLRFAYFYGPDSEFVHDLIGMVRKGWAPVFGAPDGFYSTLSHDDAATAVVAALDAPVGVYNVVDDEPLRRRELVDALAEALDVARPKLPPAWAARLLGSTGELLGRSLRISNRKFKDATGWAPQYPSVREGWRAVVAVL